MRRRLLQWYGHVYRRGSKKILEWWLRWGYKEREREGGQRKGGMDSGKDDMLKWLRWGLSPNEDADDRIRWHSLVELGANPGQRGTSWERGTKEGQECASWDRLTNQLVTNLLFRPKMSKNTPNVWQLAGILEIFSMSSGKKQRKSRQTLNEQDSYNRY